MSLDVYLNSAKSGEDYWRNITHNVSAMASDAMLYYPLWRPEEIGVKKARQLIPFLKAGIMLMELNEVEIRLKEPSNGWGSYDGLLEFVRDYLRACQDYPNSTIRVSR